MLVVLDFKVWNFLCFRSDQSIYVVADCSSIFSFFHGCDIDSLYLESFVVERLVGYIDCRIYGFS